MENATLNVENQSLVRCPCKKCQNLCHQNGETIVLHLLKDGMDMSYTTWIWHGEQLGKKGIDVEMTNTYSMSRDVDDHYRGIHENVDEQQDNCPMNFVEDVEIPLYPGCSKYTRLSAAAVLNKHKTMYGYSNKSFDNLLEILCDMLPELNTIPNSTRSVEMLLKPFQLDCIRIHACVNDCCLFRNDLEKSETCPKCGSSRWKLDGRNKKIHKGSPTKVLTYFPIIPRFRRMFESPKMQNN